MNLEKLVSYTAGQFNVLMIPVNQLIDADFKKACDFQQRVKPTRENTYLCKVLSLSSNSRERTKLEIPLSLISRFKFF